MAQRAAGRGTRATGSVLLILVLLRAITALLPSMWAWGVNVQRFLAPIPAWLPWALTAATLHPAIATRLAPHLDHVGDRWMRGRGRWLVGLAAGAVVWSLPDRTWMTGDFMIREMAPASGGAIISFTEALPIEAFLYRDLPKFLAGFSPLDPNVATRTIGAIAAGAFAIAAMAMATTWQLKGGAAAAAAATIFFGGYLCAFTGLGKPAAFVGLLTATTCIGATRFVKDGRGAGLLGASVGIALVTHRSTLALLPLWIAAVATGLRRSARGEVPAGRVWLATLPPIAGGLLAAPRVWEILQRYDLPRHLAPAEVTRHGVLAAAFAPLHLVDLANLLLFYAPLLPAAAAVAWSASAHRTRAPGDRLLLLLVATVVPMLLFIHPRQGIFRDLDVFVPMGVACAVLAARGIGRALLERRLDGALAPALVAAVALPALQWLVLFHDPDAGFARTRAFATESPARPPTELAQVWDFMAYRAFRMRDWEQAVEASERSARYAPHPRALMMWAIARTYTGDHRGAESLYVSLTERTPDDPLAWLGLGGAALRAGDSVQTARALAQLDAYAPDGREARAIRRHLRIFPEVWPSTREVVGGEAGGTRR